MMLHSLVGMQVDSLAMVELFSPVSMKMYTLFTGLLGSLILVLTHSLVRVQSDRVQSDRVQLDNLVWVNWLTVNQLTSSPMLTLTLS